MFDNIFSNSSDSSGIYRHLRVFFEQESYDKENWNYMDTQRVTFVMVNFCSILISILTLCSRIKFSTSMSSEYSPENGIAAWHSGRNLLHAYTPLHAQNILR